MIDVASLMPSEFKKIKHKLVDPKVSKSLLQSLKKYVEDMTTSNEADEDRLYVLGVRLSDANIWDCIDAKTLAQTFKQKHKHSLNVLLECADLNYSEAVIQEFIKNNELKKSLSRNRKLDSKSKFNIKITVTGKFNDENDDKSGESAVSTRFVPDNSNQNHE